MKELEIEKDNLDKDLEQLELHTPSMRFAKSVVEKVRLETNLIQAEKNPIGWIPKFCIAGFSTVFVALVLLLTTNNTAITTQTTKPMVETLTSLLLLVGGVAIFLALDRLLKYLLVK